jgi:formylglycine-generating enzyme required for sulfatase activity
MGTWGKLKALFAAMGLYGLVALAAPARAQSFIDPNSGIDFVTVGAVNNPAWTGGGIYNNNHGSVGYVYNIGKFEVTTAQWAEFMNAAFDRPANDRITNVIQPFGWGAVSTAPNTPGGRRWTVPAGNEMIPTGGISWRTAAIYCNWLHNGMGTNREAFLSGAYNVSTFGAGPTGGGFTDQITRSPGARYWIPSIDEWMKAAHYDPNRPNADGTTGGWWLFSNSSDSPVPYGPPGQTVRTSGRPGPDPNGPLAQANSGWRSFDFPGFDPFNIPLGAYEVTTPWGMYDAAGAMAEWTEGIFQFGTSLPEERLLDGSVRNFFTGSADRVSAMSAGGDPAFDSVDFGLRIASSIPSPGVGSLGMCVLAWSLRRKRSIDEEGTS